MPDIYLRTVPSDANPNDVRLYDPTVADAGGTINATLAVTLENVTQAATADLLIQATAAQTIAAFTQAATADLLINATASQTIAAFTQAATADLLINATASQTLAAVTQAATSTLSGGDINATANQLIDAVTQAASAIVVALPASETTTERRGGAGHQVRFARYWKGKYAGYFNDIEWVEWLLAALAGDIAEAPKPPEPKRTVSRKIRRVVIEPEAYIEKAYPAAFNGLLELKLEELETLAMQRQNAQLAKLIEAAAKKKRRHEEEDDIAFMFMAA